MEHGEGEASQDRILVSCLNCKGLQVLEKGKIAHMSMRNIREG